MVLSNGANVNVSPMNTKFVKSASEYQLNTGFVTVVEEATRATAVPSQTASSFPVTLISAAVALGVTATVTDADSALAHPSALTATTVYTPDSVASSVLAVSPLISTPSKYQI